MQKEKELGLELKERVGGGTGQETQGTGRQETQDPMQASHALGQHTHLRL